MTPQNTQHGRCRVLMGFYYGLGDLICAAPLIRYLQGDPGLDVHIALGENCRELLPLIDVESENVWFYRLFGGGGVASSWSFMRSLLSTRADITLVSPHAADSVTSWKIPIALRIAKMFTRRGQIVGAASDRFSRLYDLRLPTNKEMRLVPREIMHAKLAGLIGVEKDVPTEDVIRLEATSARFEIVIHVGASRKNKRWPARHIKEFCDLILQHRPGYRIGIIGLQREFESLPEIVHNPQVQFVTGSMLEIAEIMGGARAIVTMDSGFSHLAAALSRPHVSIFGSTDPKGFGPSSRTSTVEMQRVVSCQPCNRHACMWNTVYCMEAVRPADVFNKLCEARVF